MKPLKAIRYGEPPFVARFGDVLEWHGNGGKIVHAMFIGMSDKSDKSGRWWGLVLSGPDTGWISPNWNPIDTTETGYWRLIIDEAR